MAGLKTFTLFLILGLSLFVSTSLAARNPFTTSISYLTPASELNITVRHTLAPIASPLTKNKEESRGEGEEEDDECSGLELECLIRRSIMDHTDYIYTQDINNAERFIQ